MAADGGALKALGVVAFLATPVAGVLAFSRESETGLVVAWVHAAVCVGLAIAYFVRAKRQPAGRRSTIAGGVGLIVSTLLGAGLWMVGVLFNGLSGLHGRPLRVRGKIVRAAVRPGDAWAAGPTPDVAGLDAPTRAALAALWLHDAQTEHASVPAFARIAWQLAAVGAPPALLAGAHRAALEEIEHARRCFALAAAYGGAAQEPGAIPALAGLDAGADPLVALAVEGLRDGGLLEGFNADVAEAAAAGCTEPVVRALLLQIAAEERAHAELSWAIVEWALAQGGVEAAVAEALAGLGRVPRPHAVAGALAGAVARADAAALVAHGRVDDAVWAACWARRLADTRARAAALLAEPARRAA